MISKKTKDAIKEATTVKPYIKSQSTPSDAQIIYGPLLKYGATAIAIVAVIVTTAIMTERQIEGFNSKTAQTVSETGVIASNEIDAESIVEHTPVTSVNVTEVIAESETDAESIVQHTPDTIVSETVSENNNSNKASPIESTETSAEEKTTAKEQVASSTAPTLASDLVTSSTSNEPTSEPVASTEVNPIRPQSKNAIIMAQHREVMLEQGQIQLERMKLNHERHINTLRQQFSQQNSYIEQNIKQIESNYLKQVAAFKKGQDLRQSITNRI